MADFDNSLVWECPTCGRQTIDLPDEPRGYEGRPYICDGILNPHPTVEMEQKLPDAFEHERQ